MNELKQNYKDYLAIMKEKQQKSDQEIVQDFDHPMLISVQTADSGKPKWQSYHNSNSCSLDEIR